MRRFVFHDFLNAIIIVFIVVSLSCNQFEMYEGDIVTIPVHVADKASLDIKVKIQKIIQLDDIDEAIFGRASRVDLFDGRIFVLDNLNAMTLFVFDSNGVFKNRIAKGKGPGECIAPADYYLNKKDGSILLYDVGTLRFSSYDSDLEYLNSTEVEEGFFCRNFTKYGNGWLMHYQNNYKDDGNLYSFLYYSEDFNKVRLKILPNEDLSFRTLLVINPISRENYETVFCRPFDQNLYVMDTTIGEGEKVRYYMDFGEYNIVNNDIEKGIGFIYEEMNNGRRVTVMGNPIHSNLYTACSFVFKSQQEFFIFNNASNEVFVSYSNERKLPKGELKCLDEEQQTFILLSDNSDFAEFIRSNEIERDFVFDPNGNNVLIFFTVDFADV